MRLTEMLGWAILKPSLLPMGHARQLELAFEDHPRWDAPALEAALAREAGRTI